MNRVTSIAEHLERQDCGHLHDTTTRYDHEQKLLSFLLICPICSTEKVLEAQRYEPRYAPQQPLRRAA